MFWWFKNGLFSNSGYLVSVMGIFIHMQSESQVFTKIKYGVEVMAVSAVITDCESTGDSTPAKAPVLANLPLKLGQRQWGKRSYSGLEARRTRVQVLAVSPTWCDADQGRDLTYPWFPQM